MDGVTSQNFFFCVSRVACQNFFFWLALLSLLAAMPLSAYELQRLKNISNNYEKLSELGLADGLARPAPLPPPAPPVLIICIGSSRSGAFSSSGICTATISQSSTKLCGKRDSRSPCNHIATNIQQFSYQLENTLTNTLLCVHGSLDVPKGESSRNIAAISSILSVVS